MPDYLDQRLTAIEQSSAPDKLLELGDRMLRELGIAAYSYTHLPPFGVQSLSISVPISSSNFSPEFVKLYGEKQWFRNDPFIKHAMRGSSPMVWSDIERMERKNPEYREFFEAKSALVQGDGLAVPAYGPHNTHGYFALAAGVAPLHFTSAAIHEIQSICNAVHIRYCQLAAVERASCGLSSREIQTMKCVIRGLTTNEIATQLNVTANTVNTYLKRAFEKLDVTDRVSASMRFLALGYLYE